MELLARTLRSFRYLVGGKGWLTLLTVFGVCVLELAGRRIATTDWYDLPLASILVGLLIVIGYNHHRSPLPGLRPVTRMLSGAGQWMKQWFFEIGYDLRGEPPVKRGLPPMAFGLAAVLFGWGAVLLIFGDYFPQVLRSFGV